MFKIVFLLFFFLFTLVIRAQENYIPIIELTKPNIEQLKSEDEIKDSPYRIGVFQFTNVTLNNGIWTELPNGQMKWQVRIKSKGAKALSFIFEEFILSKGSYFYVENHDGEIVSSILTNEDMLPNFQQHIALCKGDDLILTLIEKDKLSESKIKLSNVIYNYRGIHFPEKNNEKINQSASCEVNVNCEEGIFYNDEKKGICRIYVVSGLFASWCTGSLINNLAKDFKPYILTALHCGPGNTTTANQMLLWKFYFNYEAPACENPSVEGMLNTHFITGCERIADSEDHNSGSIEKSDFLLVKMGNSGNQDAVLQKLIDFDAYWNGWDSTNEISTEGVGIHHPAGDIKKISTYLSPVTSSTWASIPDTHWEVKWAATENGHGVTEGGSSGSPLFSFMGGESKIIGTLSGGAATCSSTQSTDLYGKLSYHMTSNGSIQTQQLKPYLDPNNTNSTSQIGSYHSQKDQNIHDQNSSILIFPNPVSKKLYVDLSKLKEQRLDITISNELGQIVESLNVNTKYIVSINVSDFDRGTYIIKVKNDQINRIEKIIKE